MRAGAWGDGSCVLGCNEHGARNRDRRLLHATSPQVVEDMDLSDLSEALYKQSTRAALSQLACRDQTRACVKKPPPLSKVRAWLQRRLRCLSVALTWQGPTGLCSSQKFLPGPLWVSTVVHTARPSYVGQKEGPGGAQGGVL